MIDLHSHILPGVDDGVRDAAEALELARGAVSEGVHTMAATPHVREDYPTSVERMEAGVQELRRILAAENVPLHIVCGGEIALERISTLGDDLERFTLAQTGRYLLIEFPDYGWPLALDATIQRLRARGITAVLGHPERNSEVRAAPQLLAEAVEQGALVQVTAGAVEGRFGRSQQRAAQRLFELGLAHVLASDAHGPSMRSGGIAAAAAAVGDANLARYLTVLAPAAIVAGEPVPAVPRRSGSRFRALLKRQY